MDRMYYLYHRLGIQSNILVSARYSNNGRLLARPDILAALQHVVEAHPMLRAVAVKCPSPRKGRHILQLVMLHEINVDSCIEYVEDPEGSGVTPEIIERAHNEWQYVDDKPGQPWFKLVVVGQRDVVLVYHHMLADGMSGYVFHQDFLTALNTLPSSKDQYDVQSRTIYSDPATTQVPPDVKEMIAKSISMGKPWNTSMRELLWLQIVFFVLTFLFPKCFIFSSLPSSKPYLRPPTAVADITQRTVTRISSVRIQAARMAQILAVCRANRTTFTLILITMLMVTLANDYNPEAIIGASRFSLDVRSHLPIPISDFGGGTPNGSFINCSSGAGQVCRLGPYRRMVRACTVDKIGNKIHNLNTTQAWKLARDHKAWMSDISDSAIRALLAGESMGQDLDDFVNKILPMVGTLLSPTFLVSNLGVFQSSGADEGTERTRWRIVDVQFSAAATNGQQGSQGLIFNVAGTEGGDTVITAAYEEGILSREMAQSVLDTTVERLLALTD